MSTWKSLLGLLALALMNPSVAQISPFLAQVEIDITAGQSTIGLLRLDRYLRCRNGASRWEIDGALDSLFPNLFSVTLHVNTAPAPCTRQIGPDIRATPALTLLQAGFYTLRIVDEYGTVIGRQTIAAKRSGLVLSQFDVAGNWHQPEASGSGLMLSHKRKGSEDAVFGIWHAFNDAGNSRWQSFQNATWRTPTLLSGTLYETKGGNCGVDSCGTLPTTATRLIKLGTFEIEFSSEDTAILRMRNPASFIEPDVRIQRLK